jgi:hypothetical protein
MRTEEDLKGIIIMMSVFTKLNKSLGDNKKNRVSAVKAIYVQKGGNNAFRY